MQELVSIIVPSYNCKKYIGKCIESVIDQTYTNWELLITDDCSSDGTTDIINDYVKKDNRIKLYKLQSNSGAAVARNNSIQMAQGRYIAFLDSDDMWTPNKLEVQIDFMKNKNCILSYTSLYLCDEEGNITGLEIAPKSHSYHQNWFDNKCGTSTAIYDTADFGKILMPNLRKRQDWGLFMSILRKCGKAYGLKQPLAYYRQGQQSLSKNKWSLIKYNLKVYQDILKWPYILSLLFFIFCYMPCYTYKVWLKQQYNK